MRISGVVNLIGWIWLLISFIEGCYGASEGARNTSLILSGVYFAASIVCSEIKGEINVYQVRKV